MSGRHSRCSTLQISQNRYGRAEEGQKWMRLAEKREHGPQAEGQSVTLWNLEEGGARSVAQRGKLHMR